MERILAVLIAALLLFTLPSVSASHDECTPIECPLWARGHDYSTPYTNSYSYDWHDDYTHRQTTQYVFHDVQHPPKHYFVHYNDNFYRHYGYGHYYAGHYRRSPTILQGAGFNRYY